MFPIIGVSEDGSTLLFPGSIERPRKDDILPTARSLALELRATLVSLEVQGVDMGKVEVDVNTEGRLAIVMGDGPGAKKRPRRDADELVYKLRHGIELTVWKRSEGLDIRIVADFLAQAMAHFKRHRDELKTGVYKGRPYGTDAKKGRKMVDGLQLACPVGQELTAAQWTEAIIDAYSSVNTVEQMMDDLPTWQQAVQREGSSLLDIVAMLGKPGGDLAAMDAMLKRGL